MVKLHHLVELGQTKWLRIQSNHDAGINDCWVHSHQESCPPKEFEKTFNLLKHNFEKVFAKKNSSNFGLMVNSGSSANLLMVAAACNPMRKNNLKRNDEVIIPAVCWSTSLWPLIQHGLKPVFVDIDVNTLNMNIQDLKNKITKKTKAIMCVHVLGLSTDMSEILKIVKKNKLILFEDTCESLGSKFKNKKLGNFGDFGSYSFYYSRISEIQSRLKMT